MRKHTTDDTSRSPFPWARASALLLACVPAVARADAANVPNSAAGATASAAGAAGDESRAARRELELARAEVEQALGSERAEKRRVAVSRLAEFGDRPAWERVLKCLSDPEPEVADEAELALPCWKDARLWEDLAGEQGLRSRDPWVRLRAAGAFGRSELPVEAETLLRALDAGDPELSRLLLWSLERQHEARRLVGKLAQAVAACQRLVAGRGDGLVRGAALSALEKLDHFAADALLEDALVDRDPALRCAAVAVLARAPEQECLDVSRRMLGDAESRVRVVAIENLERLQSRAAALALVEQLQREPRSRLRWEILGWLQAQSGLEHGFEPEAWKAWAATIQGRVQTGDARPARGPLGDTRVAFAGLSVVSDRVAFLIDLSGSVWDTKVGERTRKQLVDDKLREVLLALPPEARFNVIPFTGEPHPWEKTLVACTPANVKRAVADFERCHATGRGNFYDAARAALLDPEVDTLCVLTDGVPTGGHRWNLELMNELLVEHGRFRRVAFDSVLVDSPRKRQGQWAELARRTGGRSVALAEL